MRPGLAKTCWPATFGSAPIEKVILSRYAGRESVEPSHSGLRTSVRLLPAEYWLIMYGPVKACFVGSASYVDGFFLSLDPATLFGTGMLSGRTSALAAVAPA